MNEDFVMGRFKDLTIINEDTVAEEAVEDDSRAT